MFPKNNAKNIKNIEEKKNRINPDKDKNKLTIRRYVFKFILLLNQVKNMF
jgi:hypothetical protein